MQSRPRLSALVGAAGIALSCNAVLGLEDGRLAPGGGGTGAEAGSSGSGMGGKAGKGGGSSGRGGTSGSSAVDGGTSGESGAGGGGAVGGASAGAGSGGDAGAGNEAGAASGVCGDGVVDAGETCDDKNRRAGEGCSATCMVESGWSCTAQPSECERMCGNGMLDAPEECDDQNSDAGDGCFDCAVEDGWECSGDPPSCEDIDECDADPCQNAGTCTNEPGSYACNCTGTGYSGRTCGTPVDDCDPNPCENGGTCTDGVNDYTCACVTGYTGNNCETFAGGPSCSGMTGIECQGGSCCESPLVTGGTFSQGPDPEYASAFQSTVSSFRLDKYEVTVGRFRRFVAAYDAWRVSNPADGAGAHPSITGSGWSTAWSASLPASSAELTSTTGVKCNSAYQTWVDGSGNDTLPINCVSWYEAFAFCIWDGKRIPTEAEWEYAAAGGANDDLYPWGSTPAPTKDYAVYDCLGDDSAAGNCAFTDILAVGSKPAGKGLYEQRDLAGSMYEWALDWYSISYPLSLSTNYAKVDAGSNRVVRGGYWGSSAATLVAVFRNYYPPPDRYHYVGFRCAMAP